MMILPERTFDIWVALAVERKFPSSLQWAPTTNAQAYREPWDLQVNVALSSEQSKAFFFENKGVDSSWNIGIDVIQLAKLIRIWEHKCQTVWYALPCVPKSQQRANIRKIQNKIGNKSRVFTPLQIRAIVQNQIFDIILEWLRKILKWLNNILQSGRQPEGRLRLPRARPARICMYHILSCVKVHKLDDFLEKVAKCEIGNAYRNNGSDAEDELTTRQFMQEIVERIVRSMKYEDVMQALTTDLPDKEQKELMDLIQQVDRLVQQLDEKIRPKILPKFHQIPMSSVVPYTPRP